MDSSNINPLAYEKCNDNADSKADIGLQNDSP